MMRILLMADVDPDPNAGAAGTEMSTASALRALGHEVDTIWAPQLGRRIAHGNLHYLLELPRAYRREMRRAAAARAYDVIHVNQPHGFLAAGEKPHGTVFVHRSHGLELRADHDLAPWRAAAGLGLPLPSRVLGALLARHTRKIVSRADGHIVSCTDDADFLVDVLHADRSRVAVILQAAPDEFLSREPVPMTDERLQRVLYVSQFAFFKAPGVIAAAMNGLAARKPDLRFTWVCPARHHAEVRRLLRTDRVELRDWMPIQELIDVYDAHGIFLFGSYFEGFGKVFLEAMSRGLCVIATRAGATTDIIADGRSGWLVEPGDVAAMMEAAERVARDPGAAAAMSAAAAHTARQFTWERTGRETAAFYERLRAMRR
jgi:glycosyltransferase involved in cell wall biosynthesis